MRPLPGPDLRWRWVPTTHMQPVRRQTILDKCDASPRFAPLFRRVRRPLAPGHLRQWPGDRALVTESRRLRAMAHFDRPDSAGVCGRQAACYEGRA
jgi:hypothetical protein